MSFVDGGCVDGGPPLVSSCCGSPGAADRPRTKRLQADDVASGAVPCRAVGFRPARFSYAASVSSAGFPLSMIICSVSLAVYPH